MKIGFIGMGFVGGTTAKVLGDVHEIIPYDIDPKKGYQGNFPKLKNAKAIFLSVPTPMMPSGEIDYSPIRNSLEALVDITGRGELNPLVIVRSTAVSGTTDMLEKMYPFDFAFNPEFLKEKNAEEDMRNTDRVVIGANKRECGERVEMIYRPLFPNANYIHLSAKEAEMVKYMANGMLTLQIAAANEFYQICKAVGINYDKVKNTVLLDDRIGKNLNVPGWDGDLGFGKKCFPKDLNALIHLARENNYRPHFLEEAWRLNEKVRKNKDWLDIKGATSSNSDFDKY